MSGSGNLIFWVDQMLGSICLGSVKELQKYVPQEGFLECQALGTVTYCSGLIKCMPGSIVDRSVSKLKGWLLLQDQMPRFHLHFKFSQRAQEKSLTFHVFRSLGVIYPVDRRGFEPRL
jgi:hypothetical protein